MNKFLDIITPRFVTEKVAGTWNDGEFHVICVAKDLRANEFYDEIITVQSFNLLGVALFPKIINQEEDEKTNER